MFLHIQVVVCPPTQIAPPIEITAPTKIHAPIKQGPWGGMTGGSLHEMGGKSRRLESVTIYHHGAVEGLQFSYVDEDGQIHTTDTWGVNRGLFTNEVSRFHTCVCGCFANPVGSCMPSS